MNAAGRRLKGSAEEAGRAPSVAARSTRGPPRSLPPPAPAPLCAWVERYIRIQLTGAFSPGIKAGMTDDRTYTAFADDRLIASGPLQMMLARTKAWVDRKERGRLLIFDDETGREVDFNFRGTVEQVVARASPRRAGSARTTPARGGRARGLAPAAALGVAGAAAQRDLRGPAPPGGRGAQARAGEAAGARPPRGRQPHHGGAGRRPPWIRGGVSGALHGKREGLRAPGARLARRRAQAPPALRPARPVGSSGPRRARPRQRCRR